MSKKMMKRTAALSALIAISLSGTVFAAPTATPLDGTNGVAIGAGNYSIATGYEVTGVNIVEGNRSAGVSALAGETTTITLADGAKLDIKNHATTANRNYGIAATSNDASTSNCNSGTVSIDGGADSVVTVEVTAASDQEARGIRNNYGGTIDITAGELSVTVDSTNSTQNAYGFDAWNDSTLMIDADKTEVEVTGSKSVYGVFVSDDYNDPNGPQTTATINNLDLTVQNTDTSNGGGSDQLRGIVSQYSTVELTGDKTTITINNLGTNYDSTLGAIALSDPGKDKSEILFKAAETVITVTNQENSADVTGIAASGNSYVDFSGATATITVEGGNSGATGINAQYSGTTVISSANNELTVTVSGNAAGEVIGVNSGIYYGSAGKIDLKGTSDITATNNGTGVAYGAYAEDATGSVALADTTIKATAASGKAAGMYLTDKAAATVSGTADITATGKGAGSAYGVRAENGSEVTMKDVTINATSEGGNGFGFILKNGTETNGSVTHYIGNTVTVDGKAFINVNGANDAQGVYSEYSQVTFNDNVTINAEADGDYAYAFRMLGDDNTATSTFTPNKLVLNGAETTLYAKSEGIARGIMSSGTDISDEYNVSDVGKKLNITVEGKTEAIGVLVQYNAKMNTSANTDITIAATSEDGEAIGIWNKHYDGGSGDIELTGDVTVTAEGDTASYAVFNDTDDSGDGNGSTSIGSATSTVSLTGDVVGNCGTIGIDGTTTTLLGDIEANGSAAVSAAFKGEKSSFTGTVTTGSDAETTVGLSGGATWTSDEDSNLTNLTNDGGNIEMMGKNQNITVDNFAGDGGTVTTNSLNNKLAVKGNNDATNTTVKGTEALTKQLEKDGTDVNTAVAQLAQTVDGGESVATVELAEGDLIGATTAQVCANGQVMNVKEADNTKSDAVSNANMNLKAHFRAHMNDMNKRMGELRMANGETGAWARMVRGEYEYQGAKSQHNQYQFGYDKKLASDDRWTVGAAITVSEGDGSYGQGYTEDNSRSLAIYGSKLNDDGSFVDLIARYIRMDSDIVDRVYGDGEYDTDGYSFSAEVGKRYEQKGFWIEPQAELTYGSVDGASVLLGNKYRANYDSMDSIVGRLGFSLGKDIKQGNVYARASYLYDFDGESATTFNGGKTIAEDFGGGWWEVGVGANIQVSDAAYVYADVEKTFGGELETNWQWNLGVRYSF